VTSHSGYHNYYCHYIKATLYHQCNVLQMHGPSEPLVVMYMGSVGDKAFCSYCQSWPT